MGVSDTSVFIKLKIADDDSLVHLGMTRNTRREYPYYISSPNRLRKKFPQARSAYWCPGHDVSPRAQDDGFKQEADNLLEELRKGRPTRNEDDSRKRPVIFICWGMAGGILLKQVNKLHHGIVTTRLPTDTF
jgi:hypothetical protein